MVDLGFFFFFFFGNEVGSKFIVNVIFFLVDKNNFIRIYMEYMLGRTQSLRENYT